MKLEAMKLKRITVCLAFAFAPLAVAEEMPSLADVNVSATKLQALPSNASVDLQNLLRQRSKTNDSAKLLDGQAGVSLMSAGGVSSLPVIHGMADDRVRVKVDGMDLISACANHMNSPLSYIDPANVASVKVFAGITPVSVGGDSIAGTIQVDSAAPEFASAGQKTLAKGQVGVFYRSNNQAQGANAAATLATESVSLRYTGSTVKAKNYTAGGNFKAAGNSGVPGVYLAANEVGSSQYQANNNALALALKQENHLFEIKLGLQHIPYQGYPNVRMDMLKNDSQQINLSYAGQYDWGGLQMRAYNEHTQHYMNFLEAKKQTALGMPMSTDGKNTGVIIKGDVLVSERNILRAGVEYQRYRMNDYWDPISTVPGMMAPNVFWNINNGQRDRLDVFAEVESRWNEQWLSQFGLRSSTMKMDTGKVQGYNNMAGMMGYGNPNVATSVPGAFNAANRAHTDNNLDATALARYTPDEQKTFELGLAQKTRSPNLYERYAWSTNNFMVMSMNSFAGDGNGYVGNLALKPEVARTLSGSASWHKGSDYEVKISPFYTHIQDYIGAQLCGATCGQPAAPGVPFFSSLRFVNQSARLVGSDISARAALPNHLSAAVVVSYVRGKNLTTGDNLYQVMPLNAKLSLEHSLAGWNNGMQVVLVNAKNSVESVRKEPKTAGYGLLNLYSSYEWQQVRFDVGVDNLLNKFYNDPLGGKYIGQQPRHLSAGMSVPGMGRSINVGLTVKF
ncbi:MAG: TonB-dependent receptor [Gallionella sp.]